MTTRRTPISDLPFWPRLLSHEEAARYVGVSTAVFDHEVSSGIWPPALRRGPRNGKATWDRLALDRAADRASGLDQQPVVDPRAEALAAARAAAHAASERYVDRSLKRGKR